MLYLYTYTKYRESVFMLYLYTYTKSRESVFKSIYRPMLPFIARNQRFFPMPGNSKTPDAHSQLENPIKSSCSSLQSEREHAQAQPLSLKSPRPRATGPTGQSLTPGPSDDRATVKS